MCTEITWVEVHILLPIHSKCSIIFFIAQLSLKFLSHSNCLLYSLISFIFDFFLLILIYFLLHTHHYWLLGFGYPFCLFCFGPFTTLYRFEAFIFLKMTLFCTVFFALNYLLHCLEMRLFILLNCFH